MMGHGNVAADSMCLGDFDYYYIRLSVEFEFARVTGLEEVC